MKRMMVVLGLFLGLGLVATAVLDGLAKARTAAAMESAARAVQIQATAGAVNTIGLTVVIVLLAVMVVTLLGLVVLMGKKRAAATPPPGGIAYEGGKWIPGPNARWGKRLPGRASNSGQIELEDLERALQILRALDGQAGSLPALPAAGDAAQDDDWRELFG